MEKLNKKGRGGAKGRDRDRENEKKKTFFVLACGENERQISLRTNKKRMFLGASPYDFTPA